MAKGRGAKRTKGPGRPERFTPDEVIAALRKARGIMRYAASSLGCHRTTISGMAKRHAEVQAVLEEETEGLIDTAEGKLAEAIARGELGAIIFFLKTRGKRRGYIERGELTGADGKPLLPPPDLTKLSDEELHDLHRIMGKLEAKAE